MIAYNEARSPKESDKAKAVLQMLACNKTPSTLMQVVSFLTEKNTAFLEKPIKRHGQEKCS